MDVNEPGERPDGDSASARLDSWKEIAAYLRRDVRTVQRWHDRAGLPVHRHVDPRQRGVFAFRGELDAWANQARALAENTLVSEFGEGATAPAAGARQIRRGWWILAAVLLSATAVGVVWTARHRSHPVALREHIWVIVPAFDNQSGDEILGESLQFVLERELSASSLISVVPQPRVQDVLVLMRRASERRLTPALAREVALRDGAVKALVTGRIDRPGSGYLLTLQIIDAHTGATVTSRSTEVQGREALLGAVRQLSGWARDVLGETGRASSADARLPQVTTASLPALQLYAKAYDAIMRGQQQSPRVLLESALREDPDFALAHSWLAAVLMNDPDFKSVEPLIKQHEDRALELSTQTTERERLHIVGMYHMAHRQPAKALGAWESLIRMDPTEWLYHQYASAMYSALGRTPEALREAERVAQLLPNDFDTAVGVAQSWTYAGDLDRARPHVERARALWPTQRGEFASEVKRMNLPPGTARRAAWVFLFPAYERWRAQDIAAMLRELQQVLDANPLPAPVDRDALLTIAVGLDMSAGRLKNARRLVDLMFQDRIRELHLAVLADAVDDAESMRRHMERVPVDGEERPLRFARAGLYEQAEYVIAHNQGLNGFIETALGELARRHGRFSEAVEHLARGLKAETNTLSDLYLGSESLADALEHLNRRDEALDVLEKAAATTPLYTRTGPSGAFWLHTLNRLSREYRDRGRVADAHAIDARLRGFLSLADRDHPLVLQLAQR
jgi:tetratricopeptide (TPR) repeat protein